MSATRRRQPQHDTDPWYGRQAAAEYVDVAPRTLDFWSQSGRVKVGFTPGGQRRWRRSWLDQLLSGDDPEG